MVPRLVSINASALPVAAGSLVAANPATGAAPDGTAEALGEGFGATLGIVVGTGPGVSTGRGVGVALEVGRTVGVGVDGTVGRAVGAGVAATTTTVCLTVVWLP